MAYRAIIWTVGLLISLDYIVTASRSQWQALDHLEDNLSLFTFPDPFIDDHIQRGHYIQFTPYQGPFNRVIQVPNHHDDPKPMHELYRPHRV